MSLGAALRLRGGLDEVRCPEIVAQDNPRLRACYFSPQSCFCPIN